MEKQHNEPNRTPEEMRKIVLDGAYGAPPIDREREADLRRKAVLKSGLNAKT